MDNIWQRHRTFILWILAGFGVLLVGLIVLSMSHDRDVDDIATASGNIRKTIRNTEVPASEDTDLVRAAKDRLDVRVEYVADKVGVAGEGGDLTEKLVRKILTAIDRADETRVSRYLDLARRTPKSCIVGLEGEVREHLNNRASMRNVLLPESLGFANMELESTELIRYLITLDLVIHLVDLAIEDQLIEVKSIMIETPSRGRFKGGDSFISDYPVKLTIRGHSLPMLHYIQHLSGPGRFVPIRQLHKFGRERGERDENVMTAVLDLMALRLRLGS